MTPEKFTRDGITIFRRYAHDGAVFYTRMRVNGKVRTLSLAETAGKSFEIAIQARRARRELVFDRWRTATTAHAPSTFPTVAQIVAAYRSFHGNIKEKTKEKNIHALRSFLTVAMPDADFDNTRLDTLTAELVRKWKRNLEFKCAGETPERRQQLLRSANSILTQARSLFARSRRNDLLGHYQDVGLTMPATLEAFRKFPAFGGTRKTEYHAPDDKVITATLQHLDAIVNRCRLRETVSQKEKNLAIACWAAIGFGLRAGDITRCIKADFKQRDGDVWFDPIWLAKNGRRKMIGVQLDAWPRLSVLLEGVAENGYIITGTQTERTHEVFYRVTAWMKSIGWRTTHQLHELRAWAGGKVVTGADGNSERWEAARIFMRHSHLSTTQNYYGQHVNAKLEKIPLPSLIASVA